jgi:hypothetical protein
MPRQGNIVNEEACSRMDAPVSRTGVLPKRRYIVRVEGHLLSETGVLPVIKLPLFWKPV